MNKKEIRLLEILLSHQDTYISGQVLAEQLSVSEKTLRKIIKEINEQKEELGAEIEVAAARGYHLVIYKSREFYTSYQENKERLTNIEDVTTIETDADRERYILHQLFFQPKKVTKQNLLQKLYISLSSLSKLLSSLRRRLSAYQLTIKKEHGYLYIEGDEKYQRRFIIDYFLAEQLASFSFYRLSEFSLFQQLDVKQLYDIILEVSWNEGIYLSDYALINLLVHLALAIKRLNEGHRLENLALEDTDTHKKAESVSEKIIEQINCKIGILLPEEEAAYIALHLLGKGNGEIQPSTQEVEIEAGIQVALQEINQQFPELIQLDDENLMQGLLEHFRPLLFRLEHGINLSNPLYDQIQSEYKELLLATKQAFSKLKLFAAYQVSDQEWAYVLLHILAAMERQNKKFPLKVLLVCASGLGSAQILKARLENHFGYYLNIIDCISFHELKHNTWKNVDLIISSIDLSEQFFPKPILQVSVLLNHEDIQKIEKYLNQTQSNIRKKSSNCSIDYCQAFDYCCSSDRFLLVEQAITKDALLEKMVKTLSEGEKESFKQEMFKQLSIREELGSVAFSQYVAMPHPAISLSAKEEAVIAVCKQPIVWDEHHQKIQIVILLSPSQWENQHIRLLSQKLANFIQNEQEQEKFLTENNFETIRQLICL